MRAIKFLAALCLCLAWASVSWAANCNALNGTCFWIGGAGTLDFSTDSAHWSNTTGGASCTCEPSSTATLTFDGSSGGGTVTVNANFTTGAITAGAFTGILDFSANNNSITLNLSGGFSFSGTGSGRQLKCGTGTFTLSAVNTVFTNATITNETAPTCGSETWAFTGANSNLRTFNPGTGFTYGTLAITGGTPSGCACVAIGSGTTTFAAITISGQETVIFPTNSVITVGAALTWAGASGSTPIGILSSTGASAQVATIKVNAAVASSMSWLGLQGITFDTSAGATYSCTNCFNLGHNTIGTISGPLGGNVTGGGGIIGGGM